MTEENRTPAAAPEPVPAPASAPAAPAPAKKPLFARKGVLIGGGVAALVIALVAGFGLGYWTARPEHDRHGRAWVTYEGGYRPFGGGGDGPRMPQRLERHGPPAMPAPRMPAELRPAVTGSIGQINGDDWTVNALDGKTVTVRITGQTTFGTAQFPQERPQFATGDTVVVRGKSDDNVVTATNVIERQGPRPPR